MRKILLFLLIVIFISGCNQNTQIANPASVYCEENGGVLDIRTDIGGSQIGYCIINNSECEEWAFYRGECSFK